MLGAIFDKVNKLFKKVDTNLDGQISQLPSQIWTYSNRELTQALQATYIEGMTPHIETALDIRVAPNTTATILSVSGSGILVGIILKSGAYASNLKYKLIIDGTIYFIVSATSPALTEPVTYVYMFPFNSSFTAQAYNTSTSQTSTISFLEASYLLH